MKRHPVPVHRRGLFEYRSNLRLVPGTLEFREFLFGPCLVLFAKEDHEEDGEWHHVSVSCKNRYPTWEELKRIAELLFPKDAEVMQIVATPHPWVNLHKNCFHLWSPIGKRLAPRPAP